MADVYSAFLLSQDEWALLYRDRDDDFIYYRFPNPDGQRIIAKEIGRWMEGSP